MSLSRKHTLRPIEAKPGQPLYQSVKEAVRAAIDSGSFAPGDRLPSTKAISEQMSVSLVTVHRALQELVTNGVLRRGQGRGTFVHEEYQHRSELSTGLRFGLVFHRESSLADYYHGQLLEGVRQVADDLGVDLVLLQFGEDWRNECQGFLYVNPFREQLERSPRFGARRGQRPTGSGKGQSSPIMVIGASFERDGVSTVDTDNRDIARQAVNHLVGLGHRRLCYVGGTGQVSNDVDRRVGFVEAMAAHGLTTNPAWFISGDWRLPESEKAQLASILRDVERPTAIFAAGYYLALDVYSVLQSVGLRVPHDVSVVGVDNPISAAHLSPPLTTLRQPLTQMGRLAARGLFDLIGDAHAPMQRTLLRAELMIRGSTGPAR